MNPKPNTPAASAAALGSAICECRDWCDNDLKTRLLTGHHDNCKHSHPLKSAYELIEALARGMECWAQDEDGIHPDAWQAYRKAKALQSIFLTNDETEHQVAVSRTALFAAAAKVRDILLFECREKAQVDPFERDINLDYHVSVTITVGEIKAFVESVNGKPNAAGERTAKGNVNE